MDRFGFVRIGIATPRVAVGNPRANAAGMLDLIQRAATDGCDLVLFPELSLTGYTCADLFHQNTLLDAAEAELGWLAEQAARIFPGLVAVGLPARAAGRLYNVAALCQGGRLLGAVPKSHLPNYKEFYERRWFTPAQGNEPAILRLAGQEVPFGTDLLFAADGRPELVVGVEICEDLWIPIPPSCRQALAGASVLLNLSASNESTGKADYRRNLVVGQSARCIAAYAYAAAGVAESTTDLVFGGHSLLAENGSLLAEGTRFARAPQLIVADVDLERLHADRIRMTTFFEDTAAELRPIRGGSGMPFRFVAFPPPAERPVGRPRRLIPAHPFVPSGQSQLAERCAEIFETQVAGLAKRVETARVTSLHIGVSGGLDSTLALLVAAKTCDCLQLERRAIHGITMPGFGTTEHTRGNAERLMRILGVRSRQIDIRPLSLDTFRALGHRPFGLDVATMTQDEVTAALAQLGDGQLCDLVFENVQARIRTLLLMNAGFVVGTGDLSELALGWCTYNADHMSMYNPNASIPKTLVRFLVRWAADHEFEGEARTVLHSIADTVISPELLPAGASKQVQSTESTIGPYELHDFFLYHVLRYGFGPRKVLYLAEHAEFTGKYSPAEIRRWLKLFYQRFFANQFKRSCLPDGPKVGSVSLSPRGDWRMPSDADGKQWLAELDG